ncbi:hypothetical protein MSG28_009024 [Choristoneura fumiferana]|uniref:Uncharacterized protein n=1 Tax=Choristoneura fumiferana TaxID=7141 RepID=A0ACC0J8X4_CHOFU|nr:hypothetical protein MSG28_009024 [Choristoneura fumiferana]
MKQAAPDDNRMATVFQFTSSEQQSCKEPDPDRGILQNWAVMYKNGSAIFEQAEMKDRFKTSEGGATLELPRALEEDWGNYSCALGAAAGAGAARENWRLHARVYTRLPSANTNVVEGQKLRLICKVVGRPAPAVEWRYNESLSVEGAALSPVDGERATVRDSEAGVRGGELVLEAARRSDAGSYVCAPLAAEAALAPAVPFGHTALRVKDMYAALWPFLGICAEVLVLCAVILVYEKRRTKPELDDSDTDNHDQ